MSRAVGAAFRHHLHPALLAVFLFEDVFLSGGDELQALGRRAGRPFVSGEALNSSFVCHTEDGVRKPVAEGFVVLELLEELRVVFEHRGEDALESLIVLDLGVLTV